MKNLALLALSLLISTAAIAGQENRGLPNPQSNVYNCGLLRAKDGSGIYGGPGYTVTLEYRGALLTVSSPALLHPLPSKTVQLEFVSESANTDVYQAEGMVVSVTTLPNGNHEVSIRQQTGNDPASASCTN